MPGEDHYTRRRLNKRGVRLRAAKTTRRKARDTGHSTAEVGEAIDDSPVTDTVRPGVVTSVGNATWTVRVDGTDFPAKIMRGAIPTDQPDLVVGDEVRATLGDETATIVEISPRRTFLSRLRGDRTRVSQHIAREHVLAANVDIAVIVASASAPPFHPRLVDRYLVICQYGDIAPVLCLNKIDLIDELPAALDVYRDLRIPVVTTSVATGEGLAPLRAVLRHKTAVFTGHSGVGKSSLINALLGGEMLRVGEVGGGSGQGRHTTTNSRMLVLEDDTMVIDTPGIRSLGVWQLDKSTLRDYFPEFSPYTGTCRYRDCSHTHEPECAIKTAVEEKAITRSRYESYARLLNN